MWHNIRMKRDILAKLQEWKQKAKRKPLILQGARQIGKTYSLIDFAKNNFAHYTYINFEEQKELRTIFDDNINPQTIIQRLSISLEHNISEQDLIIFDEVQECPRALTSLKYFCEQKPNQAVISAGSLLGVKLNELSYPVGKVDHIEMYPMNFTEFLQALNKNILLEALEEGISQEQIYPELHQKLWNLVKLYFITGGLPEVVLEFIKHQDQLATAFEQVRYKQQDLITDYLGDMAKHAGKENAVHLQRLWNNIGEQLSQSQTANANKFKFKSAIPEKNRYSRLISSIDWLEAAGLIIKIPILDHIALPLKSNLKASSFKLFVFDIGLLGAMIDLAPKTIYDYDYGTYKGFFAENYVAQALVQSLCNNKPIFSWQEAQKELEFVLDLDGEITPIEVKAGQVTKAKSIYLFREQYHNKINTIVSGQNLNIDHRTNVYKIPLYLAGRLTEIVSKKHPK